MTEIIRAQVPRGSSGEKDPNDYAKSGKIHVLADAIAERIRQSQRETPNAGKVPSRADLIGTEDELAKASLAPRCIVEAMLFADVAQLVAPGGTGKTTLMLYEAVCIALGRSLYGLRVLSPGWTLFVTAEDRRERLLARLREILARMDLTPEDRALVLRSVVIWDVTGEALKLTHASDGNIRLTSLADDIVAAYKDDPPAVVNFDPLVSFGVSEQAVNDNEQALVTAARRIVRGLDCCVRFVHHTGKANARAATLDQYSGRGGSAMADGSRMTMILQAWKPDEAGSLRPPPGCASDRDSSLTVLARAKISYAPPNLPLIWIKRTGFAFEHFTAIAVPPEQALAARSDQLERFLVSELANGRHYTRTLLEESLDKHGMTKVHLRTAIADLEVSGRVVHADLPEHLKKGGRKTYLHPAETYPQAGGVAEE